MSTVLIAGATGALGKCLVSSAKKKGLCVRALGRRQEALESLGANEIAIADALSAQALDGAMASVDLVISALGASVSPEFGKGYRSYQSVDTPANANLIRAAERGGVRRFIYVSVAGHSAFASLSYVRAHEAVVSALETSSLDYAVVRPTGFFSAFGAMVPMAARGAVPLLGDPEVRTNPIADEDVAEQCLELAQREALGRQSVELGGPEVLTRREIAELAFRVQGRTPKLRRLPDGVVRAISWLLRPVNPRVSDLLRFVLAASNRDCLAAPYGQRKLGDYFGALVGRSSA